MLLQNLITVPENATLGGAPIDAFQADAFRRNDALFEKFVQAILCSPLVANGVDNVTNPETHQVVYSKKIIISSIKNCVPSVPLIWMAQESITITSTGQIIANGAGAQHPNEGDFGGAGGSTASAVGRACKLPLSEHEIIPAPTSGNAGGNLTEIWASRALATLALCRGGASGGGANGGNGGGVIILCAPKIEIQNGGKIEAKGAPGLNNSGGGGGGLVIAIGHEVSTLKKANPGQNIFVDGGTSLSAGVGSAAGTGQAGGTGTILIKKVA